MRRRRTTPYENSFSEDTVGKFKFQAHIDVDGRLKLSMHKEFANAVHFVIKTSAALARYERDASSASLL